MKCNLKECIYSDDCGFLDITGKVPKDKYHCSWYTTSKKDRIKTYNKGDVADGGSTSNESSKVSKGREASSKS